MTPLHEPRLADFSSDERTTLERISKRMRQMVDQLFHPNICFQAQRSRPQEAAESCDGITAE